MARTARTRTTILEPMDDPVGETMLNDQEQVADELAEVLANLGEVDQGRVKGTLYLVTRGTGRFEWIKDIYPPFDWSAIYADLKAEVGGGDFQLRLTVQGRRGVLRNIPFSIMKDRTPATPPKGQDTELLALLIQSMNGSKSDMMQMMLAMNQAQAASSDRMMQMMGMLIPAMMGQQMKPGDLVAMMATMRENPSGGMKDTLDLLTTAKGLFGDGGGGDKFDPDDLVGSLVRGAGPVLGAVAKAVTGTRQDQPPPQAQLPDYTRTDAPGGALQLAPRPPGVEVVARAATGVEPRAGTGKWPILDLVRDDVLFAFRRGHDPDQAADLVMATLDREGVEESAINDLVGAFIAAGADWPEQLAA